MGQIIDGSSPSLLLNIDIFFIGIFASTIAVLIERNIKFEGYKILTIIKDICVVLFLLFSNILMGDTIKNSLNLNTFNIYSLFVGLFVTTIVRFLNFRLIGNSKPIYILLSIAITLTLLFTNLLMDFVRTDTINDIIHKITNFKVLIFGLLVSTISVLIEVKLIKSTK